MSSRRSVGTSPSVKPAQILTRKMKEKIGRSARLAASLPENLKRAIKDPLLNLDDTDTPRTILRNIKQTQPEAMPIPKVLQRHKKRSKPETRLETSQKSTEDRLSDMSSNSNSSAVATRQKRKKPVSLAEFARGVDEKIQCYQEMNSSMPEERSKNMLALANRSGLMRSFQLTPDAVAEPESIQKKVLARRPRKRRIINVEDFEERVEQKFQLLKGGDGVLQEKEIDNNISSVAAGSVTMRLGLDPTVKKGLVRRPKKHRLVNRETFEGGVEQKFQQLKGSQECYIDPSLTTSDRSVDTRVPEQYRRRTKQH